jgi:DNA invertase Pin-like site-specific DNA recombinase
MAFAMAVESERGLVSQRTREALRFKKAQGLKLGRLWGPVKSQAGCLSAGDRGPAGERFDAEVHRAALSHHRGQSAQLAQKAWLEDREIKRAHLKFYGTFVSFV